jgi:hypothetical protein
LKRLKRGSVDNPASFLSALSEKELEPRMTRASDEFLKALGGLRRAANNLGGAAAKSIGDLARIAGAEGDALEGGAEGLTFEAALAETRRLAERELSGNAFYAAMNKLEAMASLASAAPQQAAPAPVAPEAHIEPEPSAAPEILPVQTVALQGASFDELASASKARVEAAATSFGIAHHHHDTPPPHRRVEETPAPAAELEKRSSEPCSMPEIEPIASAAVEAVSVREVVEAAHDIGTPAMAAALLPEASAAIEAAPQPETVVETPAPEPTPTPEPAVAFTPEPEPAPPAKEALPAEPVAEAQAPEPAPKPDPVVAFQPEPEAVTTPAKEAAPAKPRAEEPAPAPKPEPAVAFTPKPEPAAAPAKEAPPAAKRDAASPKKEPKPKAEPKTQQKTLFGLWLDMLFGRRK